MVRSKHRRQDLQLIAGKEAHSLLADLPDDLRDKVRDLPVVLESAPGPELLRDGIEPDLLGLFLGCPYAEAQYDPLPPRILLFLSNIWEDAGREFDEFRRQVRETLLHEIGHYLGLQEEDLAARDLE